MRTVVISQPSYFPWVGMLEQMRLADVFVIYDDVAFSKGSFANRVQVKTGQGVKWLTVPLEGMRLGQRIKEVHAANGLGWRRKHLATLAQAYAKAPHAGEMLGLAEDVLGGGASRLCELSVASMKALSNYFEMEGPGEFHFASSLGIGGHNSPRVLDIVKHFGGARYVTGHGARDYLDHAAFDAAGVRVEYLDYRKTPYPQQHGPFTPHVSALDLVANCGRAGRDVIASPAVYWKDFLK